MQIISDRISDIAEEIYAFLSYDFKQALIILQQASSKSFDECESFLIELCNDYEDFQAILLLKHFIV